MQNEQDTPKEPELIDQLADMLEAIVTAIEITPPTRIKWELLVKDAKALVKKHRWSGDLLEKKSCIKCKHYVCKVWFRTCDDGELSMGFCDCVSSTVIKDVHACMTCDKWEINPEAEKALSVFENW